MAAYTQTIGTSLVAHQEVTHPATVKGSVVSVATKLQTKIHLFHGFIQAAANTNPPSWLVQVSGETSGDEDWVTLVEIPISETGTPADEQLDASEGAGVTSIAVTLTAGFAAGDEIYIRDAGTAADGEWALIQEIVTDTSVELMDGLTNAKDSSDFIFGSAQKDVVTLDCATINRVRVISMHEGAAGADTVIKADMTTADTFA